MVCLPTGSVNGHCSQFHRVVVVLMGLSSLAIYGMAFRVPVVSHKTRSSF